MILLDHVSKHFEGRKRVTALDDVNVDIPKGELVSIQPALREFSAAALYKKYDIPYHPGALKYFKDKGIEAKGLQ